MTVTFAGAARPGGGLSLARPAGRDATAGGPSAPAGHAPAGTAPAGAAPAGRVALPVPPGGLLVAGIGELVTTDDPDVALIAYGLGSCVALSAWDPRARVGALAHFMLPAAAGGGAAGGAPVKFVDLGLPAFIAAFEARGGSIRTSQLKAAGGAAMLAINTSALEIGRRNAEAVEAGVAARGLRLAATEFGGTSGRTVQLDVRTGRLHIRGVGGTTAL